MKNILIFGAGRSSPTLIQYLTAQARQYEWNITVAHSGEKYKGGNTEVYYRQVDVTDEPARDREVSAADLVISMLPARFHPLVHIMREIFENMLTASYETKEIKAFEDEVNRKGLFFLNECGLDPGLDHMSAMKLIDRIKGQGHELLGSNRSPAGWWLPNRTTIPGTTNSAGIRAM
jgi:saccharopine dehydrogenase (NAD+, L-glutamate forming)